MKPASSMIEQSAATLCEARESQLLVIDIQTKLGQAMPAKVLSRVVDNSTKLVKSASLLGIPVLATEQYPEGLGPLVPELTEQLPESTKLFEKTCFSCAEAVGLVEQLQRNGRNQIIVTGMEAHVCILQSALQLRELGFSIFIPEDAISARRLENYQNSLKRMDDAGICISNTESVLFEWLRDASHEHFREISAMVR